MGTDDEKHKWIAQEDTRRPTKRVLWTTEGAAGDEPGCIVMPDIDARCTVPRCCDVTGQ
eukprot:gene5078-24573_t